MAEETTTTRKRTSTKTFRPEQLAKALGISGKIVRAYLRKEFTRPSDAKGTSWVLTEAQAKQVMSHFKALRPKDKAEA